MASWLKAAEDLFEVVDQRAKLVVGEKSDDLAVTITGYNGRVSKPKRGRQRSKSKLSSNEDPPLTAIDNEFEKAIPETSQSPYEPDGSMPVGLIENNESNPSSLGNIVSDEPHKVDSEDFVIEASESGSISNNDTKPVGDHLSADACSSAEAMAAIANVNEIVDGDLWREEAALISVGSQSNVGKDVEVVNADSLIDSNETMMSGGAGVFKSSEALEFRSLPEDALSRTSSRSKDVESVTESDFQDKQHKEKKTVNSAAKVQQQLEEAQGLLKNAISTGQSKEARLARVCAGLSSRLQEYKFENAQLEELLVAEREMTKLYEAHIKQLQKDLYSSKGEVSRVEANMADALSAKNAEVAVLVSSVDSLKKQTALAEGNFAELQASMVSITRNRELTETKMMQALREELAAAERRAEDERSAHNATKLAAREREVDLEQRAIEASTALARIQRTADDRASKAAELEQKAALLEVECASLNQELQDMEGRVRRGQKKSLEDGSQAIQVQAWQEEAERARRSQIEAESKLSSMEAEIQKTRVEIAAMKRDAEHYSRQEHMELEKRYRELTDLLYYKQTQLETMASDKAAAEFQLEKKLKCLQEAQLEAERNKASRRASSSWDEDAGMKTLEPLPLHYRHMVGARLQLQKAAKLLDTGAIKATKFLWRYPTARVILFFYLVFVHIFLMYLLHRLQEQADSYTSKEVAESLGLLNKTLP